MWLKKDYEYVVETCFGEVLGYFETEGLAHQFLKTYFAKPMRKSLKGRILVEKPLPCVMEVKRVKKEKKIMIIRVGLTNQYYINSDCKQYILMKKRIVFASGNRKIVIDDKATPSYQSIEVSKNNTLDDCLRCLAKCLVEDKKDGDLTLYEYVKQVDYFYDKLKQETTCDS